MKKKYRIIELGARKFEVRRKTIFGWKHVLYEQSWIDESADIAMYYEDANLAEEALHRVLNKKGKYYKVIKEITV